MSTHGEEEEMEAESGREWLANKGDSQEAEAEAEAEEEPENEGLEELKAAMERHSGAPLYCDVCKVECNAQESYDKHMVGKKHEKEVKKLKAKGGKVEEKDEPKPKKEPKWYTEEDYENYYEGSDYWCEVCECECTGEDSWNAHLIGKNHKKKLQAYDCLKRIERSGEYYKHDRESGACLCLTCDLEVTSPQVLEQHFKSQKHKQTLQDCGMLPPEPKGPKNKRGPMGGRIGGPGFGMGPPGRRGPMWDGPVMGGGFDRFGPGPDRFGPGPRSMMGPMDRLGPMVMDPRDRLGPPVGRERYEDDREPLYTRRPATKRGSVLVTNLHSCVSAEDMEELFCTIGKIVQARKIREGVAEVIFLDEEDAYRSIEMFNNRPLDGQPMYVELMPESSSNGGSFGPRSYGVSAMDRLGGISARDRLGGGGMSARDRLGGGGGMSAKDRLGGAAASGGRWR